MVCLGNHREKYRATHSASAGSSWAGEDVPEHSFPPEVCNGSLSVRGDPDWFASGSPRPDDRRLPAHQRLDVAVGGDREQLALTGPQFDDHVFDGQGREVTPALQPRAFSHVDVLPTLAETFPSIDWAQSGAYFFSRVVQHGQRRAEEMRECANTVAEAGFDPIMASAIAAKQQWVADRAKAGVFAGVDKGARWQDYADALLAWRA